MERFDDLINVIFFVVLLLAVWFSVPRGKRRQRWQKPKSTVIDGQTLSVLGDVDVFTHHKVPGAVRWEHVGYKRWKLHILTKNKNAEHHDEAEWVMNWINTYPSQSKEDKR